MAYVASELANKIDARIVGDGDVLLEGVSDLAAAKQGSLSFIVGAQYKHALSNTKASAVILSEQFLSDCPVTAIVCDNPHVGFAKAAQLLFPLNEVNPSIHPSASIVDGCDIDPSVQIAENVVISAPCKIGARTYIGPNCVISAPVEIGSDSRLLANATICGAAVLGDRALVHPGVVIGSDGFGLANDRGVWVKVPQLGRVLIGNDVEIGANTTIDRGALGDTVIEDGVKLDNQIQVAHNVFIGAHTAIAGCAGIAGSAKIGRHCAVGGGAGIQGHIEITDGVQVTGMTKISQSIKTPGVYTSGTPAEQNNNWLRNATRFKQLDSMMKRMNKMEKWLKKQGLGSSSE